MDELKCVAISDTHGMHRSVIVPDGDVLIHSGDLCKYGRMAEVMDFCNWLKGLPHKHKLVTPGNHDKPFEKDVGRCRRRLADVGATLLIGEEIVIEGVKFWASPITPTFFNWHFMKDRGTEIAEVWATIPEDVDVLITHGPAYGHRDLCPAYPPHQPLPKVAGCLDLLLRLRAIHKASNWRYPRVHCYGHIHNGHGICRSDEFGALTFINAAICTEAYKPTNQPIEFTVKAYSNG